MKILFLLLIIIHGLIHLVGLAGAFNLYGVEQLIGHVSKSTGILWLIATLLFLGTFYFIVAGNSWWWLPALAAVVLSQILIIFYWHDAKFGTIPNLVILLAVVIAFALWNFHAQVNRETGSLLAEVSITEKIITAEMINDLPAPVQRWLNYSGIVGKEQIHTVYLKQKGLMKLRPEQTKWMESEAEQYFNLDRPSFTWQVKTAMFGLPVVGRDLFQNGQGEMLIKLGGLIPVVNIADNLKLSESTMQRYLGEIVWFPSEAVSPYIKWEPIDGYSARATMSFEGTEGTAVFHFDDQGKPVKFVASRYRDINDENPTEWVVTIKEIQNVNGIRIPTRLETTWMLDEDEFTWYQFEIYDVRYNDFYRK